VIITYLEQEHGCRVTGVTHALSQRARLDVELEEMLKKADVLLCEIKAAAVDVATRRALDAGADVVYMANVPVGAGGHDVDAALLRVADVARERFEPAGVMGGAT
jgi:cyclic 2,3-diphosphoglycerate synthetase